VLIFLASTYLVIRTHVSGKWGRLTEQNLLPSSLGGDRMLGNTADLQLGSGVTGMGYGDAGGGILHIA